MRPNLTQYIKKCDMQMLLKLLELIQEEIKRRERSNQSERQSGCMTNYVKNLMEAAGVKPETVTDYELNEYHIYPCLYARKAASRLLKAEKYI